jgi:four helix bundle protein
MAESPLLIKTYDFLHWLLPATEKFPRSQRFVLAQQLQQAAFHFYELIIAARRVRPNGDLLKQAGIELEKVRLYLRLSHDLAYLGMKQYRHAAQLTTEMGRLLGGWMKKGGPQSQ